MKALVVDDVSMVFSLPKGGAVQALKNISFELRPGELMSVLGPSGCGKTTLLNIIAGFLAPTAGRVLLDERAIRGPGADRGMVFPQGALFEWLDVAQNVSFGPRMAGRPKAETREKVERLLKTVGLQEFGGT